MFFLQTIFRSHQVCVNFSIKQLHVFLESLGLPSSQLINPIPYFWFSKFVLIFLVSSCTAIEIFSDTAPWTLFYIAGILWDRVIVGKVLAGGSRLQNQSWHQGKFGQAGLANAKACVSDAKSGWAGSNACMAPSQAALGTRKSEDGHDPNLACPQPSRGAMSSRTSSKFTFMACTSAWGYQAEFLEEQLSTDKTYNNIM